MSSLPSGLATPPIGRLLQPLESVKSTRETVSQCMSAAHTRVLYTMIMYPAYLLQRVDHNHPSPKEGLLYDNHLLLSARAYPQQGTQRPECQRSLASLRLVRH